LYRELILENYRGGRVRHLLPVVGTTYASCESYFRTSAIYWEKRTVFGLGLLDDGELRLLLMRECHGNYFAMKTSIFFTRSMFVLLYCV
jgi:hypothetical protein